MGTTEDRHTIRITGIECIPVTTVIICIKPRWAQSARFDEIVFCLPLLSVAATGVSDNAPVRSKWCKFFLSRERDETEQAKALRIVQEELKRRGWTKAELKRRRKGDEAKVSLARRLREETAVSLRWIAENLYMGTWTHVSNRLYHCR
jgi:hypothetical protein